MDSTQANTKPTTFRETFRRHRLLLSLPLVLGVLGAAAVIGTHKSTYMARANLWVDTTPPNASSLGPGAAALPEQPAQAEQSLLGELITTNQFAVAVANGSLLGRAIGSEADVDADAASYLTPSQVGSTVGGPQVLALSYTAASPALARSVLQGIITELIHDSSGLSATHIQALVTYYKSLLAQQRRILATASSTVQAYEAQHPGATVQSNPTLNSLMAAANVANQQVAQTNTALSQAKGSAASAGGWMVDVIDKPGAVTAVALGKKKMIEVLLGGLLAGGLITFLGLLTLAPKRPQERWEDEPVAPRHSGPHRLGDPLEAGLTLTPAGDHMRDRDEDARGQEPRRERHSGRTVSWRR